MSKPQWIAPPEEFGGEEEVPDIEAYWDSASPDRNKRDGEGPGARYGSPPLRFSILYATLIDSDVGKDEDPKSSTLLHVRTKAPCALRSAAKEENGEVREFPAGTIAGIWTKAGMKELKKLAGPDCEVWMCNGKHLRGKMVFFKEMPAGRSAMVQFTIRHHGEGRPLEAKNDYRKESLPEYQREKRDRLKKEREDAAPIDFDDIPF